MNIPAKNEEWLAEVKLAYKKATEECHRVDLDILDLYLLAPRFMCNKRGIESNEMLGTLYEETASDYEREMGLDPEQRESYMFHFVFYYMYCHEYADIMDAMAVERVIDYITEEWNLFPHLYK
jgi:hypothetical protein